MSKYDRTEYFINLRKSYHIGPTSAETVIFLTEHESTGKQSNSADQFQFINLSNLKTRIEVELNTINQLLNELEKKLDEYKFGLPTLMIQRERLEYEQSKSSIDTMFLKMKNQMVLLKGTGTGPSSSTTTASSQVVEQFREHLGAHLAQKLGSHFERFQVYQKMFDSILFERILQPAKPAIDKAKFNMYSSEIEEEGDEYFESPFSTQSQRLGQGHEETLQLQQLVIDEESRCMLKERAVEIDHVITDVNHVHDILNQIQVMTIEQGSLLDRIDVNLDKTRHNLSKAIGSLERTAHSFSIHQKRLLLFIVTLLIFLTLLAIQFKHK